MPGFILAPLEQQIKGNYGSVYRAVKETGIADTQLRRWIKAGALIDNDGQVWIKSKGRLPIDELHTGATNDIDTTKR